jgi:hypothetical protein
MSLANLSLGGNNLYMTSLFLPRESLVSDIPAGDGNIEKLFYGEVGPHSAASKESDLKVKFMKAVFSIWVSYKIYRYVQHFQIISHILVSKENILSHQMYFVWRLYIQQRKKRYVYSKCNRKYRSPDF